MLNYFGDATTKTVRLALLAGALVFSGSAFAAHFDRIHDLEEQGDANETRSKTNEKDIKSNDDDIAENEKNIMSNDDDIAANKTMIMSNDDDIAANKTMIMSNDDDIAANTQHIHANAGEIGKNSRRITNNTDRIDTNQSRIDDNARVIASNNMAIADLSDRVLDLDERVSQVAAMGAALSAVPNQVPGDSDFYFGFGVGSHSGATGLAVGVSGRFGSERNIVLNAGAATSGGETSGRVGIGFCF